MHEDYTAKIQRRRVEARQKILSLLTRENIDKFLEECCWMNDECAIWILLLHLQKENLDNAFCNESYVLQYESDAAEILQILGYRIINGPMWKYIDLQPPTEDPIVKKTSWLASILNRISDLLKFYSPVRKCFTFLGF